MKKLWQILISLNTVFTLFALTIAFCLIGSILLPANLEFFSGIDDAPLFEWLADSGDFLRLWWIYFLIISLGLLALSTVACTVDTLLKRSLSGFLFKFSPQVMHIGVLLVMLGHLFTGALGQRADLLIPEGEVVRVSDELSIQVNEVRADINEAGTSTRWFAELELIHGDNPPMVKALTPVHPVYVGGYGLFFSTFNQGDKGEPSEAVIRVTRDPGALWAFMGGILVTLGGIGFVISRKPQRISN